MDAAEKLFAAHGYDGVGMRALATEAGVNLGAATYHFGSKESLYVETFLRRFRPANAMRMTLLREAQAEAEATGIPIALERIVECMVRPPLQTCLEHPEFPSLLARNLFHPPPFMEQVVREAVVPSIQAFIAAFSKALPQLPPDLILIREMLSMGSVLIFSAHLGRVPGLPRAKPEAFEFLLKELVQFISAGLRCAPATPASQRPPLPFVLPFPLPEFKT
jgi:AcrR family transcriptional regulator